MRRKKGEGCTHRPFHPLLAEGVRKHFAQTLQDESLACEIFTSALLTDTLLESATCHAWRGHQRATKCLPSFKYLPLICMQMVSILEFEDSSHADVAGAGVNWEFLLLNGQRLALYPPRGKIRMKGRVEIKLLS